nr:hypothetical protein [Tanacetum cinerariifolium]
MANVPLNDPNVDAPAIAPAPVNPDHAPAQPVGLGDGFAPHWIRNNIPNNQNEKELVNERNVKEFYREFDEYMCWMLQNHQKSEGSFPLHFGLQVREPPADPSARSVSAPYPDDPYVVTRDAAIADAAIATFGIDDDDDDIAPIDSQPHEPCGSPRDTH